MAYTSPSQWLDLIRRRPGSRITGPMDGGPGGILNATGQFMQRNSANPTRSWREIAAEGAARRGASSAYGAEIPMGAGVQPVMEPSSRTSSSYADTMRKLPDSSLQTSSNVGDVPDDRSFMDKIGGFFGREGTPEMLMRAGARMSQAASQPGASFLGSLGAGVEAGVDQSMANRAALAQRQALAAETQTAAAQKLAYEQQLNFLLDKAGITDPTERASYAGLATEDGVKLAQEELFPELTEVEKAEAMQEFLDNLTPEQLERRRSGPRGSSVTVNTGDAGGAAMEGIDAFVRGVYEDRSKIFGADADGLSNVQQSLALIGEPGSDERAIFDEVAGFWKGNKLTDAALRFEGDPQKLRVVGLFERLGSERALQILSNFTGAKSDFEFRASEKMAAKDRSLTPEELQAYLELMEKAYIQEMVRWAENMLRVGGTGELGGQYGAVNQMFMEDAQQIIDRFGTLADLERQWGINNPAGLRSRE